MSYKLWQDNSWIIPQTTSKEEVARALLRIEEQLKDAESSTISRGTALGAGHQAVVLMAITMLAIEGFQLVKNSAHHERALDSLEFTLGLDSQQVEKLKRMKKKRNVGFYEAPPEVSDGEMKSFLDLARQINGILLALLMEKHPDMLS